MSVSSEDFNLGWSENSGDEVDLPSPADSSFEDFATEQEAAKDTFSRNYVEDTDIEDSDIEDSDIEDSDIKYSDIEDSDYELANLSPDIIAEVYADMLWRIEHRSDLEGNDSDSSC